MRPLLLTRLWLHHWHRFDDWCQDVVDGLYLAGHNGSGKSTILDALQLVLVADIRRIKFNSSAQDSSERDLDGYVRGRRGESDWLRPGPTVSYVALQFSGGPDLAVTLGVCLEATPGRGVERTFFIVKAPLEPTEFKTGRAVLTRRKLREELHRRRGARVYDNVQEYQADLREALGGVNERFFDLFLRALHFKPLNNVNAFVEQWLLERRDLNLGHLRAVRTRLQDLEAEARRVADRVTHLTAIVEQQAEVQRLSEWREAYTLLVALLKARASADEVEQAQTELAKRRAQLEAQRAAVGALEDGLSALEGALEDARRRLYAHDVVRQRDLLVARARDARREAERLNRLWAEIRAELQAQAAALAPAALTGRLSAEGVASGWRQTTQHLADTPPEAAYLTQLQSVCAEIEPARDQAAAEATRARDQLRGLHERQTALEAELDDLGRGLIRYPAPVERLREAVAEALGEQPRLLCQLLEVRDRRWADAIEAMLGERRFNLVVAPQHFDTAVRVLDRLRAEGRVYGAGVLDLERAAREARPAQLGSLATFIQARADPVQRYVNTVLGDLIAVDRAMDLKRHRRAVTPEVVVYSEFVVRAVDPRRYHDHFIGQAARETQIANRRGELGEVMGALETASAAERDLTVLVRLLSTTHTALTQLRERLNPLPDARPHRAEAEEATQALARLDLSGAAALEAEADTLRAQVGERRTERDQARERLTRLDEQVTQAETWAAERRAAREIDQGEAEAARQRLSAVAARADDLLAERVGRNPARDEIGLAQRKVNEFHSRADNATQVLNQQAITYNTTFQFMAQPRPDEPRYEAERQRLVASELPRYTGEIARARAEAEQELREHVLHTRSEHIADAKRKLNKINAALAGLPDFGRDRYRFTYARADDVREFYDLITAGAEQLGAGPLFESEFYHQHQDAFDRFYAALTIEPGNERDAREQERLTDYRRYLTYDINITDRDTQQQSSLSRTLGLRSGGETQTPFYVTIAASFVQLYRIHERSGRPTPRLVAFDEAFSKMDQDRIGATLDLFQHFGLQIVTATPLERCEYLVPKICTSLVLTAVKDCVLVEPYQNYAARLEAGDGSSRAAGGAA